MQAKRSLRWVALSLSAILSIGVLAGCGSTAAQQENQESQSNAQSAAAGSESGSEQGSAGNSGSTSQSASNTVLNGAGATFPKPLYDKWFAAYYEETGVKINYQGIGSGGGQKQILARTVDFAGSDAPMSDEQLQSAGGKILHIPTVMGAVTVIYNLPEVDAQIKLSGDVLADIFLGKITRWNDPRLAELNPGVSLPDMDIAVAHRSDGSGTTSIFTDYLAKVSSEWKSEVGAGKAVEWPVGIGGKGNDGVAGVVKQTPGAIGYVELAYAVQNDLPYVLLRNKAGNFVAPSLETTSAAAAGALEAMKTDTRVSITDADGEETYPIAAFTYLLVYQKMDDPEKAQALVDFLKWMTVDGQEMAPELLYAPLPEPVVDLVGDMIDSLEY